VLRRSGFIIVSICGLVKKSTLIQKQYRNPKHSCNDYSDSNAVWACNSYLELLRPTHKLTLLSGLIFWSQQLTTENCLPNAVRG
jgi:hypothetical protein